MVDCTIFHSHLLTHSFCSIILLLSPVRWLFYPIRVPWYGRNLFGDAYQTLKTPSGNLSDPRNVSAPLRYIFFPSLHEDNPPLFLLFPMFIAILHGTRNNTSLRGVYLIHLIKYDCRLNRDPATVYSWFLGSPRWRVVSSHRGQILISD